MDTKPAYEALKKKIEQLEEQLAQRMQLENALREERDRILMYLDVGGVIFVALDREGKITRVNRKGCEILGFKAEEILGKSWLNHFNPEENKEEIRGVFEKLMKGSIASHESYKNPIVYRHGGKRIVAWKNVLLKNEKGEIIGAISSGEDVTERLQTEEALRASEEGANRLAQENAIMAEIGRIINASLDIEEVYERFADETQKLIPFDRISINLINSKDDTTIIAYVTGVDLPDRLKGDVVPLAGSLTEMTRRTRKSLLVNADELKDYAERLPRLVPSFRAGFRSLISIPLVSKDRVIGVLHFRSAQTHIYSNKELRLAERVGDQIASAIANAQLFAEHMRSLQALRESEERYRQLFEMESDAIFLIENETGKILEVNNASEALYGFSREELLQMDHTQVSAESSETRRATTEKRSSVPIRWHKKKDGTVFPVEISARHFFWKGREVHIAAIRDISSRIKVEEERNRIEAQLQRAEKMEALGTLAGGVAHDLNNVLSGIVGYPDLLLMQIPEDSALRNPILAMQDSGKKAATIVEDLLTLARRGVAPREVLNLNPIISDYLKSPEYEKLKSYYPGVSVEVDLDTELLNILGSPVHLSKTLMNLVSNAAEAIQTGGRIFISTENRYVDRPLWRYESVEQGDYVTLTVSDTGIGISSEDVEKIFEPFYTKKVMGRGGTGLGMTVVWGTVKDHKGYIDIHSAVGKGTTFTLYFPATRQALTQKKGQVAIDNYRGKGESILIVDDIKEQREIARSMLRVLNYAVDAVESGEEAVEYLKEQPVDLIILDMIMDPGMDGLDTYRKILRIHPRQKALIVSGFSETDRVRATQHLGAGSYLKKPYTLEKIGMAVKTELEK